MTEHVFKCGDKVRLKSGGPAMTAIALTKDSAGTLLVETIWFSAGEKMQKGIFPESSLEEEEF
jgi:uncharacterized protein YodC (DUF2158 family)